MSMIRKLFTGLGLSKATEKEEGVIFKDKSGKILYKKDLLGFSGTLTWEIKSEHTTSQDAISLHEKGRQAGQKGEYDKSIELLTKAKELDPNWAYPLYDLAYTYLLTGNSEKALELYQEVNRMEPRGFFTTKTAIYTLEGEKEGVFPRGLYMTYIGLEWMEKPKKSEAILALVNNLPNYVVV